MIWTRKKRVFAWIGATFGVVMVVVTAISYVVGRRAEPFLREHTIQFLSEKFNSDVRLDRLKVRIPGLSPLKILWPGTHLEVHVTGTGVDLHLKESSGPSLVKMTQFDFKVALATLVQKPIVIPEVRVVGLELNIPPKGQRPKMSKPGQPAPPEEPPEEKPKGDPSVIIDHIYADGMKLAMLPADPAKAPLRFEMKTLHLQSAGPGVPMKYETVMTNPKPPGLIRAKGEFGPWVSESPSESKVSGTYTFDNADLGVFKGIAGILASTGKFDGMIEKITVDGETRTPDFRLIRGGNPVPLTTTFHAIVDGRNGNTFLEPVDAVLGKSRFSVSGSVARFEGERGKTIDLKAIFKEGYIEDALRLAVPGDRPILRGPMLLKTDITVPPGKGHVEDRLQLDGTFKLLRATFQSESVQHKVDELSKRAQGEPGSEGIRSVPCTLSGSFRMGGGVIRLRNLLFQVKGAEVALDGSYTFGGGALDFTGDLKMDATVSEAVGGWKGIALKPADLFFKHGKYGTVIPIKIAGTREAPKFGANFRAKDKDKADGKKKDGKKKE